MYDLLQQSLSSTNLIHTKWSGVVLMGTKSTMADAANPQISVVSAWYAFHVAFDNESESQIRSQYPYKKP